MKVAAAKYMEEQARVKADKEEKMTKFRDSAGDAAARTLQQMYYVFSVSSFGRRGGTRKAADSSPSEVESSRQTNAPLAFKNIR